MLVPVVIDAPSGRSGSTLLMQLLGSSPEIAFDRVYPFENRYLSHALLASIPPFETMARPRPDLVQASLRSIWELYSEALTEAHPGAKYYAEKLLVDSPVGLLDLIGLQPRTIELIRDPRDMLVSIRAFDAKRGFSGFGRAPDQSEAEFFAAYCAAMQGRMSQLGKSDGPERTLVRYEDMVTDLAGVAARLGEWLGVELSAATVEAAAGSMKEHMTSSGPSASVGRWKTELSPLDARELTEQLGAELSRLGYEV